jgi:hypothetical protein
MREAPYDAIWLRVPPRVVARAQISYNWRAMELAA